MLSLVLASCCALFWSSLGPFQQDGVGMQVPRDPGTEAVSREVEKPLHSHLALQISQVTQVDLEDGAGRKPAQ